MMHHDLKLLEDFEEPKLDGRKLWEYRGTDDRTFAVGDTVTFHIVTRDTRTPTGRTVGPVTITYCHTVANERCVFSHTPEAQMEAVINAAEHFDWGQPCAAWAPCFHLGSDGHFCGRAPWWDGHVGGSSHRYTSLADIIRNLK